MFCYHCGQQIPAGAAFCNHCGTKLEKGPGADGSKDALNSSEASPYGQQAVPFWSPPTRTETMPATPAPPTWTPPASTTPLPPAWSQPLQATPAPSSPLWSQQLATEPPAPTSAPPPPSSMQRFLVRTFQPALAENALFGIILGSVFAAVAGVLICWLIFSLAHSIMSPSVQSNYIDVGYILGIIPLQESFKNGLQLFLVAHGAALHLVFPSGTDTYTGPFDGLLIVPACLLTLGGYISASTDFQNRAQRSLLRGAAIAIPYTILLFIIATQINGVDVLSSQVISNGTTLNMDSLSLILFGLLWGALFGTLGASIKLARGQWRHMLRQYLQANPYARVKGMIAGALSAAGVGFLLALLWLCSLLFYSSYFDQFMPSHGCTSADWQTRILWSIAQAPIYAVNLFLFSFGAPITSHAEPQYSSGACFSTTPFQSSVLTLRDGSLHFPWWMYLLVLIPIISLFLGGRVSAALARVKGAGPRMVQGAAIALPFTVFSILLALFSTFTATHTYTSTGSFATPTPPMQAWSGVGVTDLILWALLAGVVLGALGGVYQGSALQMQVSRVVSILGEGVTFIATPLYWLFDRLSGLPRGMRRSRARNLLYSALVLAVLLAIAAGVGGWYLIAFNQTLDFTGNQEIKNTLSVLEIALPGLLLLCACVSALGSDPVAEREGR